MARRVRASTLENRTARLKLEPRKKPYHFTVIAPGIALGYRRCAGPGRWVLRAADGHGAYWTDTIGLADDHEHADGAAVLTFLQAQDKARILVRGDNAGGPPGQRGRCARRLRARSGDARRPDRQCDRGPQADPRHAAGQAGRAAGLPRTAALARRPARRAQGVVGQPLRASRSRPRSTWPPRTTRASATRRCGATRWRACPTRTPPAVSDCPSATCARSSPPPMRSAPSLGLWTEVAATTGARPSRSPGSTSRDLQDGRADPRLMMPSSKKGKGRKRVERRPVPIPPGLAAKLRTAAGKAPGRRSAADQA